MHVSGGPYCEPHPVAVGADLRDLVRCCDTVGDHKGHQSAARVVLVGDVDLVSVVEGDAGVPTRVVVSIKGLHQPVGAIEPSVLQIPLASVMVCDVRPVCAVDRDGDRRADVVVPLVVDVGLRPGGIPKAPVCVFQESAANVVVCDVQPVRGVDCEGYPPLAARGVTAPVVIHAAR